MFGFVFFSNTTALVLFAGGFSDRFGAGFNTHVLNSFIDNRSVSKAVCIDSEITGRLTRQAWPRYLQTYLQQCSGRFSNRVED